MMLEKVLRSFIRDVLYDHTYGWYRPGETGPAWHGMAASDRDKARENLVWRCGCGWTTMDHHNGVSEWTDHSEHVAACVVGRLLLLVWRR